MGARGARIVSGKNGLRLSTLNPQISTNQPRSFGFQLSRRPATPAPMTARRRIELLIFLAAFVAYGWFNQGGGWNQNGRFAEVRAMIEQGRFAADDFLVYQRAEDNAALVRVPIENGDVTLEGKTLRLCWSDENGNLKALDGRPVSADDPSAIGAE